MRRTSFLGGLCLSLVLSVVGGGAVSGRIPIQAALPPVVDDIGRLADDFLRWLTGRSGATPVVLPVVVGTLDDVALRPRLVLQALKVGMATDDLIGLLKAVQVQGGYTADELLTQVDILTGQLVPSIRLAFVRASLESALTTHAPGFASGMICGVADEVLENGRWLTVEEILGVAADELASLGASETLGSLFEVQDAAVELYDIATAEVPGSLTDARLRLWLRCLQLSWA